MKFAYIAKKPMSEAYLPPIISASHGSSWRSKTPSISSFYGADEHSDPSVSVLRTLLDQPRWLEAYHLYDSRGSQLFERICELPEYYLTRTENTILNDNAATIIALAPVECIVELGAGSAKKTMHLLRQQLLQRKRGIFAPIDVSLAALSTSRDAVGEQLPELTFHGLHARFEDGIRSVEKEVPTLFVFLGSTVGNFTRTEFVRFFDFLSRCLGPEDFLLLGVDHVKDIPVLERAYNDSCGLTADFILNVFHNVNRILRSNFDIGHMRYHSWYNRQCQQIEMYAIPTGVQEIRFPTQRISFLWKEDDPVLVEISRKFDPAKLQKQLQCFGFEAIESFTDAEKRFSLLLFRTAKTSSSALSALD